MKDKDSITSQLVHYPQQMQNPLQFISSASIAIVMLSLNITKAFFLIVLFLQCAHMEECRINHEFTTFEFKLISCDQIFQNGAPFFTLAYKVIHDGAGGLADYFYLERVSDDPKVLPKQLLPNKNHHLGEIISIQYQISPEWIDEEDYTVAWNVILEWQSDMRYAFMTILFKNQQSKKLGIQSE